MSASLVGSEMCIRDRIKPVQLGLTRCAGYATMAESPRGQGWPPCAEARCCLLYTSDAADDM
eukprot:2904628-Alexandrium_andersonii.AAC.1